MSKKKRRLWQKKSTEYKTVQDIAEIEIFRRRKNAPDFRKAASPPPKRSSSSAPAALPVPAYIQPDIPESDGSCQFN